MKTNLTLIGKGRITASIDELSDQNISVLILETNDEVNVYQGNTNDYIVDGKSGFKVMIDKQFVTLIN